MLASLTLTKTRADFFGDALVSTKVSNHVFLQNIPLLKLYASWTAGDAIYIFVYFYLYVFFFKKQRIIEK